MNETPRKSSLPKITSYFPPHNNTNKSPTKARTRSTRTRSPSLSPPKPVQRESARLKRKSQEPIESSDPKAQKMGNPNKKKDEKTTLEEVAEIPSITFEDLKSFLSEKFEAQDQKINETIEQQNSHFKKLTEPILQKQKSTDLQLDILREEMEAQKKETSENKEIIIKMLSNNQEIMKAQNQMSNTLNQIQAKQS